MYIVHNTQSYSWFSLADSVAYGFQFLYCTKVVVAGQQSSVGYPGILNTRYIHSEMCEKYCSHICGKTPDWRYTILT